MLINMVLTENDLSYKQCSLTVMDNIADPDIRFDAKGICNYAKEFYQNFNENIPSDGQKKLEQLIDNIIKDGEGKPYDCLTGISGGVDSSYMIMKAKEWGLRPLIVHFDNGWNTEVAVRNINNIIQKTGFELYTLVVDWEEFKDLQLSYIKSGVVDLEVPTDHAIYATWLKLAKKFNIKYILNGNNYLTESIMPPSWIFNKTDAVNLLAIHKKFGTKKLKTYPIIKPSQQILYNYMIKASVIRPLNLIQYNKTVAKEELKKNFDWVDYGGKHYESFYTKFYQAYILPQKFKIDKRKAHLSNLILSKEISREEALAQLKLPLYSSQELKTDKEYFIKKLGISNDFFEKYIHAPQVSHSYYGEQKLLLDAYPFLRPLRPIYRLYKKR